MIALYVLVLALLWLGAGALARRLWSTYFVPERGISRRVRVIGGGMLLFGWLFVPVYLLYGRTALLDAEVRELCAKDGGVKVYETVRLPAERFDKKGVLKAYRPNQGENALGPNYIYKMENQYFSKGEINAVAIWRTHIKVFRRSDGKLLGDSVSYTRRGGDFPGPWHPSSYICPDLKYLNLLEQVFVASQMGESK